MMILIVDFGFYFEFSRAEIFTLCVTNPKSITWSKEHSIEEKKKYNNDYSVTKIKTKNVLYYV